MRRVTSLTLAVCLLALGFAAQAQAARTVLVVGDSLSIPLAKQLERFYSLQRGVDFHSSGKVSSGLARPDFHDWEAEMERLARRHRPDLLYIMLGANDHKPMPKAPGSLRFASNAWNREYAKRVQRLLNIARSHNSDVAIRWVGVPVMQDPALDRGVQHINKLIAVQVGRNENCRFIDTRDVLADASGRYMAYADTGSGRVKLRASDGVHLTAAGAAMLADSCLAPAGPAAVEPAVHVAVGGAQAQTAEVASEPERLPVRSVAVTAQAASAPARSYAIQESSWNEAGQAKRRAGQLSRQGLAAWIRTVDLGSKGVWHRVMIGDFDTLDRAKRTKLDLAKRYALSHTLVVRTG